MKSVMLTIRLKWFYLTYKGIKTIEVRKSYPKDFVGDVYEVVSKTNFEKDLMEIPENEREFFKQFKGKVGLKFTLNKVEEIHQNYQIELGSWRYYENEETIEELACLDNGDLQDYLDMKTGYAWHISNLEIFDKPKELSGFYGNKQYFVGCGNGIDKTPRYARLTKAPQSWQFIESEE